jgi:predicted SAM-dependent methyltransferase
MTAEKFLNVGCGRRFSRDPRWLNVDLAPAAPEVVRIDAQAGLPFATASFAAVYHSHVLEHLNQAGGQRLLRECHRVLQPGGILRVVVPDLETIARCYLARLDEVRAETPGAEARYRWAVAEMFDQMVRRAPGGEMLELLRTRDPDLRAYALQRCGAEVGGIVQQLDAAPSPRPAGRAAWSLRGKARALREWWRRFRLGREHEWMERASFFDSGEVHRWMYDEHSLRRALSEAGFVKASRHTATSSQIAGWAGFEIDAGADGAAFKPDSLYVEALKPRDLAS